MNSANSTIAEPFIQHIYELRKRLVWSALCVAVGGAGAYLVNTTLLQWLQKPLGQTLYYTSPTGGFAFLFKLCVVAGIVVALPALLYHIFRFFEPVINQHQRQGIVKYLVWSFFLAYAGIAFAYFISLPSALKFLTSIGDNNIKSLINVDDYFNFALSYVGGFAVLFQLPIIILFINRIKPLTPSSMMKAQRYIVVASFIVAAVLTPTPDPFNQAMMAAPMVVLYQVSVVIVWFVNRRRPQLERHEELVSDSVFEAILADPTESQLATPPRLPQPVITPALPAVLPIKKVSAQVISDFAAPKRASNALPRATAPTVVAASVAASSPRRMVKPRIISDFGQASNGLQRRYAFAADTERRPAASQSMFFATKTGLIQ